MEKQYIKIANEVVNRSGEVIRSYFRQPLTIIDKEDMSPVTIADREAETAMREELSRLCPTHSIIGEEFDSQLQESPYSWVIDPIDGTKSFISGVPLFGTLLCLNLSGKPILGVIDMPILGERWLGTKGQGTTYNGQVCRVSTTTELGQASLFCTEPDMFTQAQAERFQALEQQVKLRRFGGDCYNYGLLASGQIDLVVEASLHPYDWMALIPVVEEAGGVITDWNGNALSFTSDGTVIAAATRELHAKALMQLKEPGT